MPTTSTGWPSAPSRLASCCAYGSASSTRQQRLNVASAGSCCLAREIVAPPSTAAASRTSEPITAMLRPGVRAKRTFAALPATSMTCPSSTVGVASPGHSVGKSCSVSSSGHLAAVEQAGLRQLARAPPPQLVLQGVEGALGLSSPGSRAISLPGRTPDSWLITACQRGSSTAASLLRLGQHPPGLRQRDPDGELLEDRRLAPEPLDAGHVLAGQHEVDALRPAASRHVLQQLGRLRGHLVALAEQVLELVDHRDDPRPVAGRVLGAQLLQLGDLVLLGGVRAAAHLVGEERQQCHAELAVGVDVHADQPGVRQPARVLAARRELRERHAFLEVQQVQLQLVRRVPRGEAAEHGVEEVRLAGAARPADQRVRRGVAELHVHRLAVVEADRRDHARRRVLRPRLFRQQVAERAEPGAPFLALVRDGRARARHQGAR